MEGVPAEFQPWLAVDEGADGAPQHEDGDRAPASSLELRGFEALRRAVSTPGRNRNSAFHLLAADAYLTWAAEASLEESDPESALRSFLRRVVAEDG